MGDFQKQNYEQAKQSEQVRRAALRRERWTTILACAVILVLIAGLLYVVKLLNP
jgi:CHASE3 domain sensor protein